MNLKENWNVILGIALFFITIIGSFFSLHDYLENERIFSSFGKFVAVIVVGLMLVPMSKWKLKRHIRGWCIVSVIFLILSISSFFSYRYFEGKWTCKCRDGKRVKLIGTKSGIKPSVRKSFEKTIRLTSKGDSEEVIQRKVSDKLNDCTFLLSGSKGGCFPRKIWTDESINRNQLLLAGLYVLSLPFFILTMMSMLQVATPYVNRFMRDD